MFSPERPIVVGRELTKMHQTLYRGTVSQVHEAGVDPRGEFTVMLGPAERSSARPACPDDMGLADEFGLVTEQDPGIGRKEAIKVIAERYGLPAREVYAAVERVKR